MALVRLPRSLRLRLAVLVTAAAAAVISTASYLDLRTYEQTTEADRLQTAAWTAQAVADELELRGALDRPAETHALVHEFLAVTPALHDIAVLRRDGGTFTLVGRTLSGSVGMRAMEEAARHAVERRELTWIGGGMERYVVAPVIRQGQVAGVVSVTVTLAGLRDASARGRFIRIWFALTAILVLTVLMDRLVRRFVERPIGEILGTMRRAGAGEVGSRARVERRDEIGEVARGLNEMLDRLERYQAMLESRVAHTTGELRETHAELVASYRRILALREELARAAQLAALGRMAAQVAHQVGTPLNLISGYVQVMKDEAPDGSTSLHRLQTVEAQIRKVTEAIRTMLDTARRPAAQRTVVDLAALVDQVCELSRPALHAANVQVDLDIRRPVPPLLADPGQLELALFNLVNNSLDAMPGGGRLAITLSSSDAAIRLVIADSGTGIPPDVLPRIFEPWVTTKPAGRGTGLGLSLTRDTVGALGGTIDVQSEPGRGTVFTIDLPVAPAVAASAAAAASAVPGHCAGNA
jgi:signal transduction histidine kinase